MSTFATLASVNARVLGVIALGPFVMWAGGRFAAMDTEVPWSEETAVARQGRARQLFAMLFLALFAGAYCFAVGYANDLVGPDYAQVTVPRIVMPPILPATGRFFPLAFQEYNILNALGRTVGVYYAFAAIQLAFLLCCAWHLLSAASFRGRSVALLYVVTIPGVVISFEGMIYPERALLCALAAWIICRREAMRNANGWLSLGALIAAQLAIHLKETAFLIIGGFACARLGMLWFQTPSAERARPVRFLRINWLEAAQLALCLGFLLEYLIVVVPHIERSYATHTGAPDVWLDAARSYVVTDPLIVALAAVWLLRLAAARSNLMSLDPLWDALPAGALLFVAAYVKLGMFREYYSAPADLIAVLYIGRQLQAIRSLHRHAAAAGVALGIVALAGNVRAMVLHVANRRVFVARTMRLVDELKGVRAADRPVTVFFPQVGGFQIMEFAAFLNLKGIQVAGVGDHPALQFKTPHRYAGDRCDPTQAFVCAYARSPEPGDYIVYLPGHRTPAFADRAASPDREASSARTSASRLELAGPLAYLAGIESTDDRRGGIVHVTAADLRAFGWSGEGER